MVTSEGRRSLRFGTDSLWDLPLILQKEIHDLFTMTFGNSWARAFIIYFIYFITTKSADAQLWTKKQSIRHLTIMTPDGELCLFVTLLIIVFCAFQSVPQT